MRGCVGVAAMRRREGLPLEKEHLLKLRRKRPKALIPIVDHLRREVPEIAGILQYTGLCLLLHVVLTCIHLGSPHMHHPFKSQVRWSEFCTVLNQSGSDIGLLLCNKGMLLLGVHTISGMEQVPSHLLREQPPRKGFLQRMG